MYSLFRHKITFVQMLTLAPTESRYFTTVTWPLALAHISAVWPFHYHFIN
jgi:hypothetical protein